MMDEKAAEWLRHATETADMIRAQFDAGKTRWGYGTSRFGRGGWMDDDSQRSIVLTPDMSRDQIACRNLALSLASSVDEQSCVCGVEYERVCVACGRGEKRLRKVGA